MIRHLFRRNNTFLSTLKPVQNAEGKSIPQAANCPDTWSEHQKSKTDAFSGPSFEQKNLAMQPSPPAAIELVSKQPIQFIDQHIASCDGGGGALGHPKVFINLDRGLPIACGYCGKRFQMVESHH